jgi:hypothetical protein
MNKYASLYLTKLSETIDGDPHITKDSKKQDPTLAGLSGAAGSLIFPFGAAIPGAYAGVQSKSVGEGLKATGYGILGPLLGMLGGGAIGGLGGAALGGLTGGALGLGAGMSNGAPSFGAGVGAGIGIPAGAISGATLGALLGAPVAGYVGSRNAARKYNERLEQELNKQQKKSE